MIFLDLILAASAGTPLKAYRPKLLLTIQWASTAPHAKTSLVSYRIDPAKSFARRLVDAQSAPFEDHPGPGSTRLLPDPDGGKLAILYAKESGGVAWVDVWNARPPVRVAAIPCEGAVRVDWLVGQNALSIVERDSHGYRTRVVGADGRERLALDRCLGAIADPTAHETYVARYAPALSAAAVESMAWKDFSLAEITSALQRGQVWFEARGKSLIGARRLSNAEATRLLWGREGRVSLSSLAGLAYVRTHPLGFARHWLFVRAADKGPDPKFDLRRVADALVTPEGTRSYVRRETFGEDPIHGVGPDGSMLFSGSSSTELEDESMPEDAALAVRMDARGTRIWRFLTPPRSRSVVVWGP